MTLFRQALAILEDLHQERTDVYSIGLLNLGVSFENQHKFDEALEFYTRAMRISELICGNGHPMLCMNLEYMATVLSDQGKPAEARQQLERACQDL